MHNSFFDAKNAFGATIDIPLSFYHNCSVNAPTVPSTSSSVPLRSWRQRSIPPTRDQRESPTPASDVWFLDLRLNFQPFPDITKVLPSGRDIFLMVSFHCGSFAFRIAGLCRGGYENQSADLNKNNLERLRPQY